MAKPKRYPAKLRKSLENLREARAHNATVAEARAEVERARQAGTTPRRSASLAAMAAAVALGGRFR